MVTIRGIQCYGNWEDDSNCHIVYDDKNGNECDDIAADLDECKNWTQVVEQILAWADREGNTVYQLQSC